MVEAHREEAWSHTAWLAAFVRTFSGFGTKGKLDPNGSNPLRLAERKPVPKLPPKASMALLDALFPPR